MRLTKADMGVIRAWVDGETATPPTVSKKLRAAGPRLDGNWMGGTGIAVWEQDTGPHGTAIRLNDLGSKAAQVVHRQIRKLVPASWIIGSAEYKAAPRDWRAFRDEWESRPHMSNPMRDIRGGKVLATTFEDRELLMQALEMAIYEIVNRRRNGQIVTRRDDQLQGELEALYNRIAEL